MQPEFDIAMLFPARDDAGRPTESELSAFAAFWDDRESIEQNLGAISWWLGRTNDRSGSCR